MYLRRHTTIVGHGACKQGRESDRTPDAYFPPGEPTPEQARSNTLFGLALFGIALLLFAAVFGLAFVYLALD